MKDDPKAVAFGKRHTDNTCIKRKIYVKPPSKREVILAWLIESSSRGKRITRFDAEKIGDHCLNTTISEIERLDGVKVSRCATKRPTRFGKSTDCNEYWISLSDLANANRVLASKRYRRGV